MVLLGSRGWDRIGTTRSPAREGMGQATHKGQRGD